MSPYPWVPLKRFGRIVGGSTPKADEDYWGGGIPWYTPTDVSGVHGGLLGTSARTLTAEGLASCSAVLLPARSVVLTSRAPIGNVALTHRAAATNQGCKSLIPSAATDPRFVAYAARALLADIQVVGTGTTFQEVSGERLGSVRFPKPPLARQNHIAELLDHECELIGDAQRRYSSLLARTLSFPSQIFEAHPSVRAADHIRLRFSLTSLEQGWSPECEAQLAEPGGWGVMKAGATNYGVFRPDEHKALPAETPSRPIYEVSVGDVLMSRANTRELAGSTARVDSLGAWRLLLCDKLYRLRFHPDRMDPDFAVLAINSRQARSQIEARTSGASASMQNISQDVVRGLVLPRPAIEEQREIVLKVLGAKRRVSTAAALGEQLDRALASYRDSLIYEAVTGKLDVTQVSAQQMDERLHAAAEDRLDEVAV